MSPRPSVAHRVVITGASGTLGRSLMEVIGDWPGVPVLAFVRAHSKPARAFPQVVYQEVDYSDRPGIDRVLTEFRPTCVVHCAASGMQFHRPAWFDMVRFNVDVSLNLCESVSRCCPGCQLIFVSTGLAYRDQGRPLREDDALDTRHPYGASKAAADILIRSAAAEFGVPLTVFRPFSFSGPGDVSSRLFPTLLQAAAETRIFNMTAGDQVRDHCAAADVARGVGQAILQPPGAADPARIFNLGSGDTKPLRSLVEAVIEELGLELALNFGGRPRSQFEPKHLAADTTRARTDLNWQPQLNFAYAIWQLAQESYPTLKLREPRQWL
jgi:nucleoside-diphosphate-sugar epimerase